MSRPHLEDLINPGEYNALARRKPWGTDGRRTLQIANPLKDDTLRTFVSAKRWTIVAQHSLVMSEGQLAEIVSSVKQQTYSYGKREHLRHELVLPLRIFIMMWTGNSSLYVRLQQPQGAWPLWGPQYSSSCNFLTPIKV